MSHSFIFFGSSPISVESLNTLKANNFLPSLVITKPDSPKGRGLQMTPSPVKEWAEENKIPCLTPTKIRTDEFIERLKEVKAEVAILVSYGKIIPESIINLFPKGILNLHPSLLPLLRGPSPIESTILSDLKDNTGVTIMLLDSEMDHGEILTQEKITLDTWPPKKSILYSTLAQKGAELLVKTLTSWMSNVIQPKAQDHSKATYCKTINKADGCITLDDEAYKNYLKICAFEGWPGTYFFVKKDNTDIRIKVVDADFIDNTLTIKRVIPEGKKEMSFEDFKRGYNIN